MFTTIYNAALQAKDVDDLRAKIGKLPIDVREKIRPHYLTPAGKLASQGNLKAVEMLRCLGANVSDIAAGLVYAGKDDEVENYRIKYNADVDIIADAYAFLYNREKMRVYREVHKADPSYLAAGLARAGRDNRVEFYRRFYRADISKIALAYVLGGYPIQAELYVLFLMADVRLIVLACAQVGDYDNIEKYSSLLPARGSLHFMPSSTPKDFMAFVYAAAGDDTQVKKYYQNHNASLTAIIKGYEHAGNQAGAEEYRILLNKSKEKAIIQRSIAYNLAEKPKIQPKANEPVQAPVANNPAEKPKIQPKANEPVQAPVANKPAEKSKIQPKVNEPVQALIANNPVEKPKILPTADVKDSPISFEKAVEILRKQGPIGDNIIQAMTRLKNGQQSHWNPYWMKSGIKLDKIIQAIKSLKDTDNLKEIINDKSSVLHKALNFQRLMPITFFPPAVRNAKSLMAANKTPACG